MLERKEGESPLAYHKRLVYGKLVDKTLSDVDYSELAPYVYGQEYSPDVARRLMYGSRMTLQLMDQEREKCVDGTGMVDELKRQKFELAKERQRFFDQRREFNKLVAEEGRREHLEDRLAHAADELSKTVGDLFAGDECHPEFEAEENEAVLVFSDWHYGMVANNVFNVYNRDICKERVKNVVDGAIERIRLHKCRALRIVILGDLFHGAIHTSARVMSEELVCDQLMQVSEILAQAISKLSQNVENTYVYMTYGNHARTVQNKNDNIHRDNMERIIPWWLRQRLSANQRIHIIEESADEFILLNVCGHGFCASHGDLDFVKTSPRMLATLFQKTCGIEIDYILLGDKHHEESFGELGIRAMLVDSLCGTDDYANEHRLYCTPAQLLLIVNEDNGVDAMYRLKTE